MNKLSSVELVLQYYSFVAKTFEDMRAVEITDFVQRQWPIVERALIDGEGIRACDSRAHDLTCQFVERELYKQD